MDGLLIAGDAAGLLLNQGYTYRGVDFAAYSGYLAAEAVDHAYKNGGVSEENLSIYWEMLRGSFIIRMLRKFRGVHSLMAKGRLFNDYPALVNDVFRGIFHIKYDSPKLIESLKRSMVGRFGWITLLLDLWEVSRKL